MGRAPCCEKVGLKRGPWTPEEDQKLIAYISENGHGSWRALPKRAGLLRCGKSCRLRWTNYLRPDIKRGDFSLPEEQSIIQLHALLGNKWSAIASHLPRRTDNEIKNYWNTHLKKKLLKLGLDPVTHKSKVENTLMSNDFLPVEKADPEKKDKNVKDKNNIESAVRSNFFMIAANGAPSGSSMTSHMAQWESARLEAEARLTKESQLRAKGLWLLHLPVLHPLNVAPLASRYPWIGDKPSRNTISSNMVVCADACKPFNAVEHVHALHNWDESLQDQAGIMWPEVRRLQSIQLPITEAQAESSSCSSPCSDANTTTATTRSSPFNDGTNGIDHLSSSPTSTLCSFEAFSLKPKGMQSPFAPVIYSGPHTRKLSWNDTLSASLTKTSKPSMPVSYSEQRANCKVEEDSTTFSNLMQDAMTSTDAMVSAFACSQEGGNKSEGMPATDDISCDEKEIILCDKISVMEGDLSKKEEKYGESSLIFEAGTKNAVQNIIYGGNVGGTKGTIDEKPDDGLSGPLSPTVTNLEYGNAKGKIMQCKDTKNGIKACDILDAHNEQNVSAGGESMNPEMFKDLPKLKSDDLMTSQLPSLPSLLNDDIADYWSSIMLKEPSLQQVEMTF